MYRRAFVRSYYTNAELSAIISGYEELREHPNKAWVHIRIIDMWRAFKNLDKDKRAAVLLMGLMGFSSRQSALIMNVDHSTVSRRYLSAMQDMLDYLNREGSYSWER